MISSIQHTRMSLSLVAVLTMIWSFDPVSSCSLAETVIPNPADPIGGTPVQVRTSGQYTNESQEFRIQSEKYLFYEQNATVNISVCMIADGAECFPIHFSHDDFSSEYLKLQSYLRDALANTNFTTLLPKLSKVPLRDRTTGALKDTDFNQEFAALYEELELEYKSFFCKSGKCVVERYSGMPFPRRDESFKCAPGKPNSSIIPYLEFQRKFLQLSKDMSSEVCKETVNRVRLDFNSGRYTPSRRGVQFEKHSPDWAYAVKVCLLEEGVRCYPDNYTEAKIYDEFMAKYGKPGLEDLRRHGDGRRDLIWLTVYNLGRPPPHPKNKTKDFYYDPVYKDFFCTSGICNRSTNLCQPGPLVPGTLKLYRDSLGIPEPYLNPLRSGSKNLGSASTILALLPVFSLIPFNRHSQVSLLPLMFLIMVNPIWADCEGLDRVNTDFELIPDIRVITKAKREFEDAGVAFELRSDTVSICLVRDNLACNQLRPLNLNQYDPGETGDYFVYLKGLLPDSYLTLELLNRVPTSEDEDKNDEFNIQFRGAVQQEEVKLKSFFCKSGKCDAGTDICTPDPVTLIDTFNYSQFQDDLRKLQVQIHSFPMISKVCQLTVGKFRSRLTLPGRGLIQHRPGGPVLEVAVCLLTNAADCFPFNETESASEYRDYYDNDLGVLPPENETAPEIPEIPTEKNGKKTKFELFTLKGRSRLFLRYEIVDWFCFTGECDTGKCRTGTKRVSKILQLYKLTGASFRASTFLICLLLIANGIMLKIWI